jgi:hypothetical protein
LLAEVEIAFAAIAGVQLTAITGTTDSSDVVTGTVLLQQSNVHSKWHPIAYLSKSLSAVEQNYEIHNKEMLAIIQGLEDWQHFLEGTQHKVKVWTDQKNLEYFHMAKKLNCRQA